MSYPRWRRGIADYIETEENRAHVESEGCEIRTVAPFLKIGETVVQELGSRKVIADDLTGSWGFQLELTQGNVTVSPKLFASLRRVKDRAGEEAIGMSAKIIEETFQVLGMTERELGAPLVYEAMKRGGEPPS